MLTELLLLIILYFTFLWATAWIRYFNNLDARLGISGSFIEPNQIFEKKNAIDTPKKIKILKIHKYT